VSEPGRNDPCWCGSGKKFKKCHLGRSEEPKPSFGEVDHAMRRVWDKRECLHPLAARGACGKIIDAHTVQRSGALRALVDASNKVRSFYPIRPGRDGDFQPRIVGWRQASTFTGFCSVHDAVFGPVEHVPFAGTPEQCFLLSYRAVSHELYQKRGSERTNPLALEMIERGIPMERQKEIRALMEVMQAGVQQGREDAEKAKKLMDAHLLSGDFRPWRFWVVDFSGPLSVTTSGGVSPNVDLDGKELQRLHDLKADTQWMTVNIVPSDTGGSVVIGFLADDPAPTKFVESLDALDDERLVQVLPQFVFAFIENTYFSAAWWESLTDEQKRIIKEHAVNPNAYYDTPQYAHMTLVPWKVTGRRYVRAA
jgi:hypothetical protein